METALRSEIVESQKFTVDLEKWKIILIAGLGAAAFGIVPSNATPTLLALIPLVSAYVDVLVYHNGLRILVISRFLQQQPGAAFSQQYEKFCESHRSAFPLEEYALFFTTIIVSVAVGVFACRPALAGIRLDPPRNLVVGFAALLGMAATTAARFTYDWQIDNLASGSQDASVPEKLRRIGSSIGLRLTMVALTALVGGLLAILAPGGAR